MNPVILAAGGVARRRDRIAVIYRRRHDDWTLPKGKLERGEGFERAAVREVLEETGCKTEIRDLVAAVDYRVKKGPKVVLFFDMEVIEEGVFEASEEVQRIKWLTVPEALETLTYPLERDVVQRWLAARKKRTDR